MAILACLVVVRMLGDTGPTGVFSPLVDVTSTCQTLSWTEWGPTEPCNLHTCKTIRLRSCKCYGLSLVAEKVCEKQIGGTYREILSCNDALCTSTRLAEKNSSSTTLTNAKYMMSIPGFGPNNQYMGMKEALVIAKLLDRTFVRPDFWLHSQFGLGALRKFESTFNPDPLNKFIPTISLEEFTKVCNGSLDVLFWMRKNESMWMNLDVRIFTEHLTQISGRKPEDPFQFKEIVHVSKDYPHDELGFRSGDEVKKYFNTQQHKDKMCIGLALPFRNLWYGRAEQEHLGKFVIHADSVKERGSKAIQEMGATKDTLLSFHWRFGEDSCAVFDFEDYDFCFGTSLFRWTRISSVVTVLHEVIHQYSICTLYLAIADHFEDKDMYTKFETQLLALLANNHTCATGPIKLFRSNQVPMLQSLKSDNYMLSLVEQVICEESRVFVASTDSTWSDFVVDAITMHEHKPGTIQSLDKLLSQKNFPFKLLNLFQEEKVRKGKSKVRRNLRPHF